MFIIRNLLIFSLPLMQEKSCNFEAWLEKKVYNLNDLDFWNLFDTIIKFSKFCASLQAVQSLFVIMQEYPK